MISYLRSKIEVPPRWNKVSKIRDLAVTRSTGLVLVAVPTFGAVKIVLEENVDLVISIPFNFVLLYFSALFALGGSVWFDLRCPSVIKENKSYSNFFKQAQLLGLEILSKHAELAEKKDAALDDLVEKMLGSDAKPLREGTPLGLDRYTSELAKTNMLWRSHQTWDEENKSLPGERRLILLLYGASASLALWVAFVDAPFRVIAAL